jgi:hypothetical protein
LAENKPAPAANRRPRIQIPPFAYILGALALVVAGAIWYLNRPVPPPPPPVLTPEAKAYVRYLKLSDVGMKATESIAKQLLVEIEGKIGNQGDRTLKLVEINCVFYDPYGQLVLRERVPIVGRRNGTLAPGEIKNFRLAFDNLPPSWNQSDPQLVIAQILFE